MRIIPLSEGTFTVDKTKLFVPFDHYEDELQERSKGSLLVEIQPFVIVTRTEILLLDTGLGFKKSGELQLHQNLLRNGIKPDEVTKVLLTHLHKDHAGGIAAEQTDHNRKLSFSNARYFLQKRELSFAFAKGFPSFMTNELEILKDSPQVSLLTDNKGAIGDMISYEITGAHSPYHQVFWIQAEGQKVFFGGDEAPQLQQMKHRFIAKYDYDGKKAMGLRRKWWEQAKNEHWTILFYHDVKNPLVQF